MSNPATKLTINKDFARKFEHRKKREHLEKNKALLNSSSSASSSSLEEDENGELITDDLRFDFLKSLAKIKTKQPEIYKKDIKLFQEENGSEQLTKDKKTNKKFTYGDMVREEVLEKMEEMDEKKKKLPIQNNLKEETHVEEQARLKNEFKAALFSATNELQKDDDFLKVRQKAKEEEEEEGVLFQALLKKEEHRAKPEEVQLLKRYWEDEAKLDETDKFLRKYIMTKGWVDEDLSEDMSEVDQEDEKRDSEMDEFEAKYNFRFEEPDSDKVQTFARQMADSLRQKPEKRKEKRQEKKERKRIELERSKQEVALLKKAKKEEILERIQKIEDVGGKRKKNEEEEGLKKLLKEDFDPKVYEEKMREVFGEEFYEEDEGEEEEIKLKEYLQKMEEENEEFIEIGAGKSAKANSKTNANEEKNDEEPKDKENVLFPKTNIPIPLKLNITKTEIDELKKEGETHLWWYCDECKKGIEENQPHFDCKVCEDYTLCKKCYEIADHEHSMKKNFVPEGCSPPSDKEILKILSAFPLCPFCSNKVDIKQETHFQNKENESVVCENCYLSRPLKERKEYNEIKRKKDDIDEELIKDDDKLRKLVDEYYGLNFEDIIAGGIKTRFKYVDVEPDSFGLNDEQLLYADDKILSNYLSIKKIAPFNQNIQVNRKSLKKKRSLVEKNAAENMKLLRKQISKIEKTEEKIKELGKKKNKKTEKKKAELTKKLEKIQTFSINSLDKPEKAQIEIEEEEEVFIENKEVGKKPQKKPISKDRLKSYGMMLG